MTNQDIIKTALRVWGRELYRSTSLGDLARELGVSKAALYRHFTSKGELMEAMREYCFDDYASFLRPHCETALKTGNRVRAIPVLFRHIAEYYIRNRNIFVFFMIQVYGDMSEGYVADQMGRRGIDVGNLRQFTENMEAYPSVGQFLIVSLVFWVARFHKVAHRQETAPSGELVRKTIAGVEKKINSGLALDRGRIEALDYEKLEAVTAAVTVTALEAKSAPDENRDILRAVGAVVAEVGPWNASMEMVARRSGLSKSGLYAHFRNRQDMLRQLFLTEIERIIGLAKKNIKLSAAPEEQLYLGIFSIVSYLRSHSEILIALNWVRTRRLNLGRSSDPDLFRVFEDIAIEALKDDENTHWILFLVLNTMVHWSKRNSTAHAPREPRQPAEGDFSDMPNRSVRRLYRFIGLGSEGFEQ
ncbi:MAG: TetR/AcrR family transcriptional regulator [Spirochaetaceae bacterium]|jgi:AcrR family transcriptional regulator|nr:TetR/AcrR family transcriptional regulator [Spirochaetaceae bacterium]